MRIGVPRSRAPASPPEARLRRLGASVRPHLDEALLVVVGLAAYLGYTAGKLGALGSPYLPADGAHYLAEARYLGGEKAVNFIHPPIFPGIVLAWSHLIGRDATFAAAMLTALAIVWISIYVMLRQWARPQAAVLGTSAGLLLPATADILGWGGGANLLGLAPLALAIAALEWWNRRRGPRGVFVGAALGIAFLTHPFAVVVTGLCVGVRLLADLLRDRRISRGWGPDGIRGWASALVGFAVVAIFAIPYYSGLQETGTGPLRFPALGPLISVLNATSPETGSILILEVLALSMPFWVRRREVAIVSATLATIIIAFPMLIRADATYLSRVAYLIPILFAMATAMAWPSLSGWLARPRGQAWIIRTPFAVGVVALLVLGAAGFGAHLNAAVPFYSRVDKADVAALRHLSGESGTVATSWFKSRYAEPMSWYVSGVAGRQSVGPIAPWFSTRHDETAAGADMQRLLAGESDIESGRLLFAVGPENVASGALLVRMRDYFIPSAFLAPDAQSGDVERPVASSAPGVQALRWDIVRGNEVVGTATATFDGGTLVLKEQRSKRTPGADPWSLKIRPSSGVEWTKASAGPAGSATITQSAVSSHADLTIEASPTARMDYNALDAQFGGPSIRIASSQPDIEIRIRIPGDTSSTQPTVTDEAQVLKSYRITAVVIWRNTQLAERFDRSHCFVLREATDDLLIYNSKASCLS